MWDSVKKFVEKKPLELPKDPFEGSTNGAEGNGASTRAGAPDMELPPITTSGSFWL